MNIVLINPYCLDQRLQDYDIKVPPIGVYYLAASLTQMGHSCHILNWYNLKDQKSLIEQELKRLQPDITAISILHANRWGGLDIARVSKRVFPHVPVVMGGPGATFLWQHLLKHFPELDLIVMGEGENTLTDLVTRFDSNQSYDDLAGIAYRKNGVPVQNPPAPFIKDLDALPDPAQFFSFQHVISSRGCPWNCSFCGSPRIWNRTVRFHSPDYFVTQLQRLRQKGQSFFYISDDTFTLKKDRVISICQKIIDKGLDIEWAAISRVNIVDDEILYWMRRAGCIQISYGVESGSAKIRKKLNKNISDQEIQRAFELTRAYGIMPRAYFIYGNPGETKDTIKQSARLMKRIKPLSAIFYILDIFPGTQLYEDFKKRTGVNDDIWLKRIEDIMYFETDPKLDGNAVLKYGRTLRKAFYSSLPDFALNIQLKKLPELAPYHASFLSRLGMTFIFGDYANIKEIPRKAQTAAKLFQRALDYFPDHRAYLGLAILLQQNGDHASAITLLKEALRHFPKSPELHGCLGVSLMHTNNLEEALEVFLKFGSSAQNLRYAIECAKRLGKINLSSVLTQKLQQLEATSK
ncbi:MAG: radical SAM protein [Thermodesulfobacteria bacterium]|nr:radical SAM protein [Thermodesulfobacteriota bacterium]